MVHLGADDELNEVMRVQNYFRVIVTDLLDEAARRTNHTTWVMMCAPKRGQCNGRPQCGSEEGGSNQKAQGSRQESGPDPKTERGGTKGSHYSETEKGTECDYATKSSSVLKEKGV
jgi:hypothetical protein